MNHKQLIQKKLKYVILVREIAIAVNICLSHRITSSDIKESEQLTVN